MVIYCCATWMVIAKSPQHTGKAGKMATEHPCENAWNLDILLKPSELFYAQVVKSLILTVKNIVVVSQISRKPGNPGK